MCSWLALPPCAGLLPGTRREQRSDQEKEVWTYSSRLKMQVDEPVETTDMEEEEERGKVEEGMVRWQVSGVAALHGRNMRMLERRAGHIQYLLAVLSTLGGAHHLCNKPKQALQLALRQEALGHILGSTQVVLRARVFQAVNHALLGHPKRSARCFYLIRKAAEAEGWSGCLQFALASENWLAGELATRAIENATPV